MAMRMVRNGSLVEANQVPLVMEKVWLHFLHHHYCLA